MALCPISACRPKPSEKYRRRRTPTRTPCAPMPARLVQYAVAEGDVVAAGAGTGRARSHEDGACAARARGPRCWTSPPRRVPTWLDQPLLVLEPVQDAALDAAGPDGGWDPDHIRPTCSA